MRLMVPAPATARTVNVRPATTTGPSDRRPIVRPPIGPVMGVRLAMTVGLPATVRRVTTGSPAPIRHDPMSVAVPTGRATVARRPTVPGASVVDSTALRVGTPTDRSMTAVRESVRPTDVRRRTTAGVRALRGMGIGRPTVAPAARIARSEASNAATDRPGSTPAKRASRVTVAGPTGIARHQAAAPSAAATDPVTTGLPDATPAPRSIGAPSGPKIVPVSIARPAPRGNGPGRSARREKPTARPTGAAGTTGHLRSATDVRPGTGIAPPMADQPVTVTVRPSDVRLAMIDRRIGTTATNRSRVRALVRPRNVPISAAT